jgi:fatty acid-binding protein DegV
MNEQKIAILTDSSADITPEIIDKYDIKVLPLHIMYPEKEY